MDRLSVVITKIIFKNQSGFVKSRNIAENILLAQEIIGDIGKRNQHHNVTVKFDMTKAYVRLSWIFLTKVLRKFGFSETLIDMVQRLLSNNWYSILINGQSHRFFSSSRGVSKVTLYPFFYLSLLMRCYLGASTICFYTGGILDLECLNGVPKSIILHMLMTLSYLVLGMSIPSFK